MDIDNIDFAVRYPFTRAARDLLKKNQVKISGRLTELAIERILAALKGAARRTATVHEGEKIEEVASYAAARMILGYAKNSYLINKFAVAESKRASHYLSNAPSEEFEFIAAELGVVAEQKGNSLVVPLPVYLRCSPRSVDYRLVNREVKNGVVKIIKREWIRLVEEAIRFNAERIPYAKAYAKDAPAEIKSAVKELMIKLPRTQPSPYITDKTSQPPCIDFMLEDVRQHKNLPHQARWYLAVYMIKKGASDDDLLSLFSMLPDYNEKITRYQIAHARKQGYSVPSCATVLSYGLCRAQCGIKNPLGWRGKFTPNKKESETGKEAEKGSKNE